MCNELEFNEENKIIFFYHVLKSHALEFYRDTIEGKNLGYEEVVKKCMTRSIQE